MESTSGCEVRAQGRVSGRRRRRECKERKGMQRMQRKERKGMQKTANERKERNGKEWKGKEGKERKRMQWKGMQWMEWKGERCNRERCILRRNPSLPSPPGPPHAADLARGRREYDLAPPSLDALLRLGPSKVRSRRRKHPQSPSRSPWPPPGSPKGPRRDPKGP